MTHDKPWFALLVAVALLFPAHVSLAADIHALDPPFPAAKRAAIEAAVNKSFGEARAPGVVVGIWIPGEGSYVTAKGFADIKTRQPMRTADHFRIGSITKTIFKALTAVVTPNNVPQ
ncbi:MAG: serine hydrolase [Betaproteobacteria bacterium]